MHEQERHLVELVLSGRTEAFEPLVTPYRNLLLNLAYRLSRDIETAKEISQETLLRAFRYLRSYDKRRSFKNWLLQIEMNVWRRVPKIQPGERIPLDLVAEAASSGPAETARQNEFKTIVLACLEELTAREKEVFLLRDIEEMSVRETARALGSSAVSVRVHLSSARRKIREKIRHKYPHLLEERP